MGQPGRRLRRATVAIAVAMLATSAWGLPPAKERWLRVETEHFTLFTNAGKQRTSRIGRNLERLRSVLASTSAGMSLQSPLPTYLYVFSDERSFASYNIGADGRSQNWSGYFIASRTGNYVAVDASAGSAPFDVVYHEYLHYFLRNNLPEIPLWLNEGLAEFYSNFRVRGGRAEIGRPIDRHLFWLARHPLIPLEELLSLDTTSAAYNEGMRQGTVYAQSWALTHYLLADPQRRTGMGRFFRALRQGTEPARAFETAFRTSLAQTERELERYVHQESYAFYRYTPDEEIEAGAIDSRPLERAEVLFHLGDLLAQHPTGRLDDAEDHLRGAITAGGADARTYTTLAQVRLDQDRPTRAIELCRLALELGGHDGATHSILGRALMQRYLVTDDAKQLLLARRHFEKSLDLVADDPETQADLGKTYLFGHGDAEIGIDALSRAARELPGRTDLLLELIALTASTGDTTRARRVLELGLRPRADKPLVRAAEVMIVEEDIRRAIALWHWGRREEAEERIREAAHQTRDPRLKLQLLTRLVSFSTEVASTGSIEIFNQALDRAKQGEMESAAELLEQLLQSVQQPDLREAAATHLNELRRVMGHNRWVERFNEAVRQANRGDIDGATRLLHELLDSDAAESLKDEARRLLRDLRLNQQ